MRTQQAIGAVLLSLAAALACATAQRATPLLLQPAARALPADFDLLGGPLWRGTLTYLDYTSGKPTTIKSNLLVARLPGDAPVWEWRLGYDDEPKANRGETVTLAEEGRLFDGEVVVERTALPAGAIRVVTETDGEDDHRPARLRHVYTLSASAASLQKLVRFAGTGSFLERNVYRWTR